MYSQEKNNKLLQNISLDHHLKAPLHHGRKKRTTQNKKMQPKSYIDTQTLLKSKRLGKNPIP